MEIQGRLIETTGKMKQVLFFSFLLSKFIDTVDYPYPA